MYLPAEDTYLLAECALQYRGRWALEIGVGSGAVVRALAQNFENVAGSDIDWGSLRHCKVQEPRIMLACCDAASAFCGAFDLIVSNPPYLPDDKNYRAISAICSYCFKIERLFAVGKDAFNPPPKVESEVLRLVPVHMITPEAVKKVNGLFSQRNKKATKVAARMGVQVDFGDRRVDQLEPEEIMRMAA